MPTAIPDRIITIIETRLEAIATSNGYAFSVASVDCVNRMDEDFSPAHLALAIVRPDEERNDQHDRMGNPPVIAYRLPVSISAFVRLPDETTDRKDVTVKDVLQSVKRAITNVSDWYTFGGNTYNADWGTFTSFELADHVGFTQDVIAYYRVSDLDPYKALP